MDSRQRRQIILARQRLTAPADPEAVCRDLNGLQAQFFSYTRHGMATRCRSSLGPDWSRGLVKSWTVRGTMHLFREADLPLFLHRDRGHFLRDVDRFADDQFADEARKRYFAQVILEGIDSGDGAREDLRLLCRRAGMTDREEEGLFNGWGGLLRAMAEAGMICYQPREEKVFRRCPPFTPMDREAAELELARRYFAHFGPATVRDAAYYFHTSQKQVRAWLDELPVERASWEGRDCFFLDDGRRDFPDVPDCVLLAGFDQLMLGYEKKESVFLPQEHLRGIFNRSGIVLPCLLLEGQAAGQWKVSGKTCAVTPFRALKAREKKPRSGRSAAGSQPWSASPGRNRSTYFS